MSVTILPRRNRHHPTMQPLQLGHRPRRVVNVRISRSDAAIAEYRGAATMLREFNMELAARFLETAVDAIAATDDDTVVADIPLTSERK